MHRTTILVLLTAGSALSLSLARAQAPPGAAAPAGGGTTAPKPPPVIQLAASGGHWAWLKHAGEEVELLRGGPGANPTVVGRGLGWTEVAQDGENIWVIHRTGDSGELLQSRAGAAPASVLQKLSRPGGLFAAEGRVFWLESVPPADPRMAFIASGDSLSRLRVREASGADRTLGEWPGGLEGAPGDVLGVLNGAVYVRLRRFASTEFLRVPLSGGETERIAAEEDRQEGLIANGSLYWTAPTEEANQPHGLRCVRRTQATGEPETVTDWLPGLGVLAAGTSGPCYLANGPNPDLYQLPSHLDTATVIRRVSGRAVLDGSQLILLDGPSAPAVAPPAAH